MPALPSRSDEEYMLEAIRLAQASRALPYPNPWVGCVVLQPTDGKIVGRGSHRGPGTNHAEIEALKQAGARAQGAVLYVTLEPCCHFGKTPPCTDAILKAGIRKVIYALRDPNPLVAGRSARILKARRLVVKSGICSRQAAELNEVYLKYRATGLPFVTAKVAASLDGKIATRTGHSQWITDSQARRRARELRAENQAVLVGINTVLADNPHLGARRLGRPDPWRVVLDSRLRIPLASQVAASGKLIVACTRGASAGKRAQLERRGVTVWRFEGRRVPLRPLLVKLAQKGIFSVLVEGGGEVLGAFMDQNLVDRLIWFVAPLVIGSKQSPSAVAGKGASLLGDAWRLRGASIEQVGKCWMVRGNLSRWALATA